MIATQTTSPVWVSVTHAMDAVSGPLPRRLGTPSGRPSLAVGQLAAHAALWGVALGLLAPATTVLVQVSGLAADGVGLVGSTDLGFFFGFVPLLTALVVTLLAFDHWPLHDLRAYHRELAVGLLLVGAVTLVGLRAHGAAVTGDRWDHAWLFANGSLVLHVLVTWCLVRAATNDLTALHARRTGWRPRPPAAANPDRTGAGSGPGRAPAVAAGARPRPDRAVPAAGTRAGPDTAAPDGGRSPRPAAGGWAGRVPAQAVGGGGAVVLAWEAPRQLATVALAFQAVVRGVIVGTAAGAAAGTGVRPGLGTLAGGYLGAIYGLVPTAIGAAAVVTVVSWRRDTDPAAVGRAVQATLAAVAAGVLAAAWPLVHAADLPGAAALADGGASDPQRAWLLGAVVVVLLLRRAAPQLAATYVRLVRRSADPPIC